MDWKALGTEVAKLGLPLLGAVLPIPGGAAIGTALAAAIGSPSAKPEDILSALTQSADAIQKAKEFQGRHEESLLSMAYDYEVKMRQADSADVASVNSTMQAEAQQSANENWWQKGWRPFNGYVLGLASFVATVFVCVLFYNAMALKDGATIATVVAMVPQLAFAVASILAVPGAAVGITAWHRGTMQVAQVRSAALGGGDSDPSK